MIVTQLTDTLISVYGMTTNDDGDDVLASSLTPQPAPSYWDIQLKLIFPDSSELPEIVSEYENITSLSKRDKIIETLEELFPNTATEYV